MNEYLSDERKAKLRHQCNVAREYEYLVPVRPDDLDALLAESGNKDQIIADLRQRLESAERERGVPEGSKEPVETQPDPEPQATDKVRHDAAMEKPHVHEAVDTIKTALSAVAIWLAPSKGGVFSVQERQTIRSTEFRQAYYGEDGDGMNTQPHYPDGTYAWAVDAIRPGNSRGVAEMPNEARENEIGKRDHDFERAVERVEEGAALSMYYAQRNKAARLERENADLRQRLEAAERDAIDRRTAWMQEARPYLKRHGWCLHHKADRGEDERGHADGDDCWRLISELDAELEADDD